MEIETVAEGLDNRYHSGHEISVSAGLHVVSDGSYRREAKITEEGSVVPEEGSYNLRDGQYHLPVGDFHKEVPAEPDAPGFPALGVAGWAEVSGLTGEGKKILTGAFRAPNPCETAHGVGAVEVTLYHLPYDRS